MKRIITLILVLVLLVSLGACGKKDTAEPADNSSSAAEPDESASETEGLGAVEVDEGLFNVTVTVPAQFMEGVTQDDLNTQASEGKYKSATLNEDGSVSIVMSKSQHDELLTTTAASLDEDLNAMVGSDEYPNLVSIEHNADFTDFTVTTKSTELDLAESFSVMMFYMAGGMYNAFAGNNVENVHIAFVNETSGNVIEEANSRDLEG